MNCKKGHKEPKHIPYGSQLGRYWCHGCDAELVPDFTYKNRKKTERQKAQKETKVFRVIFNT